MSHFRICFIKERERVIWDKDPRNLFKLKDVELHVPAQKKNTHRHTFENKTNKIQQVAVSSAVVLDSDKDVDFLGVGGVRLPSSISTSSSSSAMDTMDMRGFRLPGSRKGFPETRCWGEKNLQLRLEKNSFLWDIQQLFQMM